MGIGRRATRIVAIALTVMGCTASADGPSPLASLVASSAGPTSTSVVSESAPPSPTATPGPYAPSGPYAPPATSTPAEPSTAVGEPSRAALRPNQWHRSAPMRVARTGFDAVVLGDGTVLAVGDDFACYPGGAMTGSERAELYDPLADVWLEV